eukprot:6177551-Karenia_brevis.AAC.1
MASRMAVARAQTAPPHRKALRGNSLSRILPALDLVSDTQHHGKMIGRSCPFMARPSSMIIPLEI